MAMLPAAASAAWTVEITAENQLEPIYFGYSESGVDNRTGMNDTYTKAPLIGKTIMHLDDLYSKKVKSQELTWDLSIAVPDEKGVNITWDTSSVPSSIGSLRLSIDNRTINMQRTSAYRLSQGWYPATISIGDYTPYIYVDDSGGADFTSIQAAVNAARDGDTIIVRDGTYSESVRVNKSVTITSENGPDSTIVDPIEPTVITMETEKSSGSTMSPTYRPSIKVTADDVTIQGLQVRSTNSDTEPIPACWCGIYAEDVENCVIRNSIVSDNNNGICVFGVRGITIEDNNITSNSLGIHFEGSCEAIIVNNTISSNNCGLMIGPTYEYGIKCLYLNNFRNNLKHIFNVDEQVISIDYTNTLEPQEYIKNPNMYSSCLGNYWDDYTGTDIEDDGIGDIPYVISGSVIDAYPLMGEWHDGYIEQKSWYVDQYDGGDFISIQDAIDASGAGDTVFVHDGVFEEDLTVDKPITIASQSGSTVFIGSSDPSNPVVNVTSNGVTIRGFTIGGAENNAGIYLGKVKCCEIIENTILANNYGIQLFGADNSIINNCNIGKEGYENNNRVGILVQEANNTKISNIGVCSNMMAGIALWNSDGTILKDSIVAGSINGIQLGGSAHTTITTNTIYSNKRGLLISSSPCENYIFLNNIINNDLQASVRDESSLKSPEPMEYIFNGNTYCASLGNYWDDYTGTDGDRDGIGDTPYVISETSQDPYPLRGLWRNGVIE
ncbi:parallel beta-helix repeat protein [Methanofollis sp. W23]|nr:parallel beta-helix repeat protein [Methanofollis sp. W23]